MPSAGHILVPAPSESTGYGSHWAYHQHAVNEQQGSLSSQCPLFVAEALVDQIVKLKGM